MPTGNGTPKVRRTIVLAPMLGDDGRVVVQREEAEQRMLDLLGALWTVGGAVTIVADRIRVGTLPATASSGPEPMGETVGLIIQYHANTPLNAESITTKLEDQIYADDAERAERAEAEQEWARQAAEAVATATGEPDDDDEPEAGEED